MAPPLPSLPGVEHEYFDLPTGVRVHVALAGPADAPRVLALHGWPQHWWMWRKVLALAGDRVRIAMPDMRGFGWSGWPADGDFTKPRLADDAVAVLDALGWERATLAGHDWGGVTSFLVAVREPSRVSSLLVCSAPHPWQPPVRVLRNLWRFAYQLPIAAPVVGSELMKDGRLVARMMLAAGPRGTFTRDEIETYVDVIRQPDAARASERLYRSFLLRDAGALGGLVRGRKLEMPTRLLCGTREPLGTDLVQGLERHGADATVELVEGAGHWLPEERPELVAERLLALVG
jgi:pimeloyl-ACP methyl ester carboxylesterase